MKSLRNQKIFRIGIVNLISVFVGIVMARLFLDSAANQTEDIYHIQTRIVVISWIFGNLISIVCFLKLSLDSESVGKASRWAHDLRSSLSALSLLSAQKNLSSEQISIINGTVSQITRIAKAIEKDIETDKE